MAQDNGLYNSSWADSVRNAIQDSIRKNKAAAANKNALPVVGMIVRKVVKKDTARVGW